MTRKIKLIIFVLGFIVLLAGANFVLAADFGVNQISDTISLAQSDPRVIIGRIIQIALSFLGAIALILVMYGGFLWMTSNGDEEKIDKAKKLLTNAVIGLIIILSSWAITTFLLAKLSATIGGGDIIDNNNNNQPFIDSGIGAIGACTVDNFYPENGQTEITRNSTIIITFKEEININNVCVDSAAKVCACDAASCNKINPAIIRIYKTDLGDACAGGTCPSANANITEATVSILNNNKTLVLTPLGYLGNPTSNAWYSVKITNGLQKKFDNSSMFKNCGSDSAVWKFEVGTRLDLTPPQVVFGSVFPPQDNEQDLQNIFSPAETAQGLITVNGCPNIYKESTIVSVNPIGNTPEATATPLSYRGDLTKFKVVVSSDSRDRAQLFDGNNDKNLLGSADFDASGEAKFIGFFILKPTDRNLGSAWEITLTPEQLADTLTVGDITYNFSSGQPGNNNIHVNPGNCNMQEQADSIYAVLSGNPDIDVEHNGKEITLVAKIAGANGNKIIVNTTNQTALQIQALKNGKDREDLSQVKGKKDAAMNTVIQMNFSEAINPLQVSGLASELANYMRVVNYATSSFVGNTPCTKDSDCRSYKCDGAAGNKVCSGDYIDGRFLVSNSYKTVEFISNNECGVNGCGEKIYCLPANSHLAVEMKSADLKNCMTDNDCLPYAPFKTCSSTPLSYKTCQNAEGKNYPTASSTANGIMDMAMNSLDGNRDFFSDGPVSYYDDNLKPNQNLNKKDNYRWSFYVNDKIMLNPPQIESVTPAQGVGGINLADPIRIAWNTLMMNSSLTTGNRAINNGSTTLEHKLISLRSLTPSAIGYWVKNDNIDTEPMDGEPDKTVSWIEHTPFAESMSYRAQAGSGIRDIYQNCFKPSAGVNCPVTAASPSCCFGAATSALNADGNCP